jgi:hypothetical protein
MVVVERNCSFLFVQIWTAVMFSSNFRGSECMRRALLVPLEELDGSLLFLCRFESFERAQIPPLSSVGIFFPRIEPVTTGLELPDHLLISCTNAGGVRVELAVS